MSFYDDERIRRKQDKYEQQKAIDLISYYQHRGITGDNLLNILRLRAEDSDLSETERAIAVKAAKILENK